MMSRTVTRLVALAVVGVTVAVLVLPAVKRIVRDLTLPLQYTSMIRAEARAEHLPASLIAAVIFAETKFDARTSPAGAVGLMQIEPATALFLAKRSCATTFNTSDLNHPAVNIAYGTYYLRYLLNHYHGNETLALAAYNGGQTNVDGWVAQAHADGVHFGVEQIPFAETRAYVKKVENAQRSYRMQYGLRTPSPRTAR